MYENSLIHCDNILKSKWFFSYGNGQASISRRNLFIKCFKIRFIIMKIKLMNIKMNTNKLINSTERKKLFRMYRKQLFCHTYIDMKSKVLDMLNNLLSVQKVASKFYFQISLSCIFFSTILWISSFFFSLFYSTELNTFHNFRSTNARQGLMYFFYV